MYSMKNIRGKESNTAKWVNVATEFNEFKDTLFNKKIIRHKMRGIQGKNHKMGTYEINKISLSVFDDKRFVLNNGVHTLAYFHKDLKNYRWLQIKKVYTNKFSIRSIVKWGYQDNFKPVYFSYFFLRKVFAPTKCTKTQNKQLSPS